MKTLMCKDCGRMTCVKPTHYPSDVLLGGTSGIHPHHFKR